MRPSKFVACQQRRLGRVLTEAETKSVQAARLACPLGKRDTIKAMRGALGE